MAERKYEILQEELHKRGLNVNRLSMLTGITNTGLYAALNGASPFWPGWRQRVAEALDMTEQELFPEGEKQQGEKSERG